VLRQVIDAAIAAERAGLALPGPVLAAAAERR
jgi:hypothetical protein